MRSRRGFVCPAQFSCVGRLAFGLALCGSVISRASATEPGTAVTPAPEEHEASASAADPAVQKLAGEAAALRPLMTTGACRLWLDAAGHLPGVEPRTLHVAFRPNRGYTVDQFEALSEADREGLQEWTVDTSRYYATFYGTPIAYARAIDLAAAALGNRDWRGVRVLDLGYGQLGQLRMLAMRGADVVGVDVDPILTALYSESGDTGEVLGPDGDRGRITLHEGLWPNDDAMRARVGGGYDLFLARNLLKYGYVKPAERIAGFTPVADRMTDEEAVRHLYDALAPGGVAVIYNLGPAPDPDKPWSDIRTPWAREAWEAAGFEVLAFDADENEACREVGVKLGWGDAATLEASLFGIYTIARRPAEDQ